MSYSRSTQYSQTYTNVNGKQTFKETRMQSETDKPTIKVEVDGLFQDGSGDYAISETKFRDGQQISQNRFRITPEQFKKRFQLEPPTTPTTFLLK